MAKQVVPPAMHSEVVEETGAYPQTRQHTCRSRRLTRITRRMSSMPSQTNVLARNLRKVPNVQGHGEMKSCPPSRRGKRQKEILVHGLLRMNVECHAIQYYHSTFHDV